MTTKDPYSEMQSRRLLAAAAAAIGLVFALLALQVCAVSLTTSLNNLDDDWRTPGGIRALLIASILVVAIGTFSFVYEGLRALHSFKSPKHNVSHFRSRRLNVFLGTTAVSAALGVYLFGMSQSASHALTGSGLSISPLRYVAAVPVLAITSVSLGVFAAATLSSLRRSHLILQ